MEVNGSVVVITGAGSGIGAAVAKRLAKDGAKVVLGDVQEDTLNQVVDEIQSSGGQAVGVPTNVCDEQQVARLMDTAIEKFGALNVAHANAGIIKDSLMINPDRETGKVKRVMSTDQFRAVIDVNLTGAFLTIREAAQRMVDHGCKGLLLLTSSINHTGQVGQLNYSSTKAALALWPKILTGEFHMRKIGIRVVGIAPGYAATDILKGMNQDALNAILKDVHIGRLVEPDELVATIKHVMENEAIDGTTIEVSGGVTYGPRARAK